MVSPCDVPRRTHVWASVTNGTEGFFSPYWASGLSRQGPAPFQGNGPGFGGSPGVIPGLRGDPLALMGRWEREPESQSPLLPPPRAAQQDVAWL